MGRNVVLTILLGLISSVGSGSETVSVADISGVKSTGTLKSWTVDKLVIDALQGGEFLRTNLRSVTIEHPSQKNQKHEPTIWLTNGDRITARAVGVSEDTLTVSWPLLGNLVSTKIALEHVMAVVFDWPADTEERLRFIADIETSLPGNDVVMLTNGDRSSGEFEGLDAAHVVLKVGANSLKLDRGRVRAVRFNPELTTAKRPEERRAILTLTEGSRLTASTVEADHESLRIKTAALGDVNIPITSMIACHLFSEWLIPLSDYEPSKVEFTPYFSTVWPLIRNANVRRGPLSIRGTQFVTGLGMHSRMRVTYALKGHEESLTGLVGIDDLSSGRGSALFAVDVDGKRAWTSPEVTGKSPATPIPVIPLHGAKELTLLVEFGQFADVLDYANWCDVSLATRVSSPKSE